ncbi:MAG TPA: hypothetical protein VIH57_03395, partial [Bacteroidales bacterium]
MSFNIDDFFSHLNNSDVVLSFKGNITSEIINNILESIENKFVELNEDGKVRKKMYNVLVECLQNLYHHIEDIPHDLTG